MTPTPDTSILLVIPCYRHRDRLKAYLGELCPVLAEFESIPRILVVDDGSPATEQLQLADEIARLRARYSFLEPLIILSANHGKGHAIRTGWAALKMENWLAFVDADGAVPAHEVTAMLSQAIQRPVPAVFAAVRTGCSRKNVQRRWYRHLGSRFFNAWVRRNLPLTLTDTQCGFKIIPRALHDHAPWTEEAFALDLEILLRARALGVEVVTHPVAWQEKPGSSLGWRNTLRLFADVARLGKTRRP